MTDHDNAYDGLLDHHTVMDDSQWAFGQDFEDPLAGVDTTIADGVDPTVLATYCLMLGDDALILSHRFAEWVTRAPALEEDVALANIGLDLLGQAVVVALERHSALDRVAAVHAQRMADGIVGVTRVRVGKRQQPLTLRRLRLRVCHHEQTRHERCRQQPTHPRPRTSRTVSR